MTMKESNFSYSDMKAPAIITLPVAKILNLIFEFFMRSIM